MYGQRNPLQQAVFSIDVYRTRVRCPSTSTGGPLTWLPTHANCWEETRTSFHSSRHRLLKRWNTGGTNERFSINNIKSNLKWSFRYQCHAVVHKSHRKRQTQCTSTRLLLLLHIVDGWPVHLLAVRIWNFLQPLLYLCTHGFDTVCLLERDCHHCNVYCCVLNPCCSYNALIVLIEQMHFPCPPTLLMWPCTYLCW